MNIVPDEGDTVKSFDEPSPESGSPEPVLPNPEAPVFLLRTEAMLAGGFAGACIFFMLDLFLALNDPLSAPSGWYWPYAFVGIVFALTFVLGRQNPSPSRTKQSVPTDKPARSRTLVSSLRLDAFTCVIIASMVAWFWRQGLSLQGAVQYLSFVVGPILIILSAAWYFQLHPVKVAILSLCLVAGSTVLVLVQPASHSLLTVRVHGNLVLPLSFCIIFGFIVSGSFWLDRIRHSLEAKNQLYAMQAEQLRNARDSHALAARQAQDMSARLSKYIEHAPVAVFVLSADGRILEFNPAAADLAGIPGTDLSGTEFSTLLSPVSGTLIRDSLAMLASGRKIELDVETGFSSRGLQSWHLFVIRLDDTVLLCYVMDVSKEKIEKENLKQRILALTPSDDAILDEFSFQDLFDLEEIQRYQDAFALANGVSSIIGEVSGKPITRLSNSCRLCRDFIQRTEEGKRLCARSDAVLGGMYDDSGPVILPCQPAGLLNAAVPIMVAGKCVANWVIGEVRDSETDMDSLVVRADELGIDREEYRKALGEIKVMSRREFHAIAELLNLTAKEFSLRAWQLLMKTRAEQEREEARNHDQETLRMLATLMRNIPGMSYRCLNNPAWTMKFVSEGAGQLTGYSANELVDDAVISFNEIIHPADRQRIHEEWARVFVEGGTFTSEYRIRTRSGLEKWVWEQGIPLRDSEGRILALEGLIMDISARVEAIRELESSNRQLGILARISREINQVLETGRILRTLVESAISITGASIGSAGTYTADGFVITEYFRDGIWHKQFWNYRKSEGIAGIIQSTGQPYFSNDVHSDLHVVPEIRQALGLVNTLGVPVLGHDSTPFACLIISNIPGSFSDREVRILELLVASAATAITNAAVIEELKRTENQLRDSQNLFETLAESAPVGIFRTDASGSTIYTNSTWSMISGMEGTKALGYGWLDAVHPEDKESTGTGWKLASRHDSTAHADYRFVHPDGTVVWVMGNVLPERSRDGTVTGYIGTIADITEHIETEHTINRLNAELERRVEERTIQLKEINSELETFAYSVSHDLRAPLRAIDGFSCMLESKYAEKLDEEGKRLLSVIKRNAIRMNTLISDILALSRVGTAALTLRNLDMTGLVQTVWQELLSSGGIQDFQLVLDPLVPCSGDPSFIRQVWVNLLSNAVKYSLPAPVHRIEIRSQVLSGSVQYSVKDHGVGFDPAGASRLFGPFQRLHSADQFEGTGVGLAIIKRIVTKHGGLVSASSRPGEGALFTFTLPSHL